jgi:uncharacterized phage protein (TIGR01671 family)
MREIKFRAWNEDASEPSERMMHEVYLDPLGRVSVPEQDTEYCYLPVMQSTGMLDTNGKPIYEGDIVRVVPDHTQNVANKPYHDGLMIGDLASVQWNHTNLRWSLFPKGDHKETDMDYYCAWTEWNWLEVIGDIYSTPELLTS